MEHVDGASLEQRLRQKGRLPLDEALAVGAAIASALSAVHRAGLVHRDVKPANIVEAHGVPKLIDFGIAAAPRRPRLAVAVAPRGRVQMADLPPAAVGSSMATLTGVVTDPDATDPALPSALWPSGTVGYIDPHCVAEGAPATPASDLYALGATLFECITGRLPSVAAAGDRGGLKGEVLDGRAPAPPLADLAPSAPPGLARLVDALLAPDRARRPASAERVAMELTQLRAEHAGRARRLPAEEIGPFRGLGRFEAEDRDVYFGRSSDVAMALAMLRMRGLVALIGAAGSGKSSLARAGIAPAVADGALGGWIKAWDIRVITPGTDPRAAIGAALTDLAPGAADLAPDALVAALARRADEESRGTLLVVDQLEELVTLATGEAQAWTAELLARFAEPATPGVRALLTARRDLLDPLLTLPGLGRVLEQGFLLVSPMSAAAWAETIDQALAAYGYRFEDAALRAELLTEVAVGGGAMPLIQFALTELWNQRDRERKLIPRAGLTAVGGIAGALDRHAEATFRALAGDDPDDAASVREVLLALTTPQGTRATRPLADIEQRAAVPAARATLAALEQARLLTREDKGLTLAHDALLFQWERLRDWVSEARDDRLLAEEIERDAARWSERRDPTLLWRRRWLVAAEDLWRRGLVKLSPTAIEFVRRARSAERRWKWVLAGMMAAPLLVGITTGYSYVRFLEGERTELGRELAQVRRSEESAQREAERAVMQARLAEEAAGAALEMSESILRDQLQEDEAKEEEERTGADPLADDPVLRQLLKPQRTWPGIGNPQARPPKRPAGDMAR